MATGIPSRRIARRADENAPPIAPATARTRSSITLLTKRTLATTTASGSAITSTSSAVPMTKRTTSSITATGSTYTKPGAAALGSKRTALGEVAKGGDKLDNGDKGENVKQFRKSTGSRAPLKSTAARQQPPPGPTRRTRSGIPVPVKEIVREERPLPKRKSTAPGSTALSVPSKIPVARSRSGTSSTTATTTSGDATRLRERTLNTESRQTTVEESVPSVEDVAPEPLRKKRKTSSPALEEDDVQDLVDPAMYDEDGKEVVLSSGGRGTGLRSPKAPRAKDYGWTDLDEEDALDPTMVSEYVVDAFNYMISIEPQSMADPNYMDRQAELQWKMRTILMEWLIEVHSKFRLLPETLLIAVNTIDRFLSRRVVSLPKLQLVGLTALFISSKYEEVICPSIQHFLHMTDESFGLDEMLRAERYMLSTLGFDLSYPNPLHFLRRISKADQYDIQTRTVAKYLIEIVCVEERLIGCGPSRLAAAAMWLARLCLERGDWSPNLVHYSGYAEDEIIDVAQIMVDFLLSDDSSSSSVFYKKYATKKHMKSSVYVRQWVSRMFLNQPECEFGTELRTLVEARKAAEKGVSA